MLTLIVLVTQHCPMKMFHLSLRCFLPPLRRKREREGKGEGEGEGGREGRGAGKSGVGRKEGRKELE